MAIVFKNGFNPEEFNSTPVWEKRTLLAEVSAGDYSCGASQQFGTNQVTLKGYRGFFTTPNGGRDVLSGNIEIWECVCTRKTEYCEEGEISQRAFPA